MQVPRDIGHEVLNTSLQQGQIPSVSTDVDSYQSWLSNIVNIWRALFTSIPKALSSPSKLTPKQQIIPVVVPNRRLPATKIDFLGRRLFRQHLYSGPWKSLNEDSKRIIKLAEDFSFVDSFTSQGRVEARDWTRILLQLYEITDAQLKHEWCIIRLFNRIQECILRVAKRREALASRVEKLFRGYSAELLTKKFAEQLRFTNFESLVESVTDGQETLFPSKDAPMRYFVKEQLLRP